MAEERDSSYRLLFSYPRMVEDLLRHFVGGEWLEKLDFETLEKVSERDISDLLIRREKDLVWRLRFYDAGSRESGWLYVYLHLEFQSKVDPMMSLRMVTHKVLLFQDLARRKELTTSGRLPPILSIVVYTGKEPWTAARSLPELIEPLSGLVEGDLPESLSLLSYHLVEERSLPPEQLAVQPGLVARLFEMERGGAPEQLQRAVDKLVEELGGPEWQDLSESFAAWFSAIVTPTLPPGLRFEGFRDLLEVRTMLEQTVVEWRDGWLSEGRKEGRKEGLATVFLRLLERKFGALSAALRKRVESADEDQLLTWSERVLSAKDLDEVFAR
ncbi:MAG: DUF4351 domain-containing protein [Thermoanaerobaculia bacterium]|nr:DUF4351 domain-containing protein [Thermoanaerobaculia bacterium]